MQGKLFIEEEIPNLFFLQQYLFHMKQYGWISAHYTLKALTQIQNPQSDIWIHVEMYAYNKGYTYRKLDGRLGFNYCKDLLEG